jgi:aminoglycoside 3-N-acetyltransferase
MSELSAIERGAAPVTRSTLADDLRSLGLAAGMTVLVHTSLSALGWVCGGQETVIRALFDLLGPDGTLVMPAHSGALSDPASWRHPPVPDSWVLVIRQTMPPFDPHWTPTRGMGCVAELFRTLPGVRRSLHPAVSFAASGPRAHVIVDNHPLENGLGETSPLARLYDLDGYVLLLGVGFENNTSFHLAEYRAPGRRPILQGAPITIDGARVWTQYADIDLDDEPFARIGSLFEASGAVSIGPAGAGTARLLKQRLAVDFAASWLKTQYESSGHSGARHEK